MSGAGNDQQRPPLIATMAGDSRRRRRGRVHHRGRSRKRSGWRTAVVLLGTLALLVTGVVVALDNLLSSPPVQRCVATLGTERYTLDPDQADHAALFAAIAAGRDLPPRAVTVAIATGMQESKLRNIAHGDRDSLGLFQQRPSQGWGTEEQVMDPVYATNAFYAGLEQVSGWESMEVTVAAQAVQRSGFPDAYAQHEGMARAFAIALTGQERASLHCTLAPAFDSDGNQEAEPLDAARQGATVAARLQERLDRELPWVSITEPGAGHDPGAEGTTAQEGPAQDDPAQDYVRLSTDAEPDEERQTTWSLAHWAVATAYATGASEVIADGMRWERAAGEWIEAGPHEPSAATGEVLIR